MDNTLRRGGVYFFEHLVGVAQFDLEFDPMFEIELISEDGDLATYPVQNSHVTWDEMLSVPGLATSTWMCLQTTSEGITVLQYVGEHDSWKEFFDSKFGLIDFDLGYWITPKGFPRDLCGVAEPCAAHNLYGCDICKK